MGGEWQPPTKLANAIRVDGSKVTKHSESEDGGRHFHQICLTYKSEKGSAKRAFTGEGGSKQEAKKAAALLLVENFCEEEWPTFRVSLQKELDRQSHASRGRAGGKI